MNTRSIWDRRNLSFFDLNHSPSASPWRSCPQLAGLDPAVVSTFFDDFHDFQITNSNELGWISTETEGGGGDAAFSIDDAANGILKIVNDGADNDSVELQWHSECWKLATGKPLWFEARAKFSDATQLDMLIGLCITDTTAIDGVTDGVYFKKDDGDTNIDCVTMKDSTPENSAAVGTLGTDYIRYGIFFDGASTVYFYLDGVLVATHTVTIPDDEELTITLAHQNGEVAAKTAYYDYVKVVQVR